MNAKRQLIAFYTLVRRELVRMFRISSQVFLPAVITTSLYFLIFGKLIGPRIGPIDHVPYTLFIAPGLMMMTVITNSYGNVSTSLFSARFQRNIEELLVSPLSLPLLLLGYLTGGILRGLIVAILVFIVASCFVNIDIHRLPLTLMIVFLVAGIFSLAGFTNGLFARTFDDVMLVPTFILTPLTYLGGVFYSTDMLSPFWNKLSHFNPIWYMVHTLRYAMLGYSEINIQSAIWIIILLFAGLLILNLVLLKKGVGLRD